MTTSISRTKDMYNEIWEDKTVLSKKELFGWLGYAWACDVYSVCAIVIAIPILLESFATAVAVDAYDPTSPCDTSAEGYKCLINVFGHDVDTTSWSFMVISISVLLQALVYVFCGSLADHGSMRKHFLLGFSTLGAISTILFILPTPSTYWLAAVLAIISNISYGASYVFFLAYIPVLTRVHRDYLAAKPSEEHNPAFLEVSSENGDHLRKTEDKVANSLSAHANAAGFGSGVLLLLVTATIVNFSGDQNFGLKLGLSVCGVWWLLFSIVTAKWLRPRPGPPLPDGHSYLTYSWKRVGKTLSSLPRLPTLSLYLVTWFILSDGFHTISHVAILFAKRYVSLSQLELLILAIIAPVCGLIGTYAWWYFQRLTAWSTKKMIIIIGVIYCLIPLYGILGSIPESHFPLGIRHKAELYVIGVLHGFLVGALGSFCRVLFAELTPRGHEAEFFAFFEVTDKGSAWVGPAVVAAITMAGDMRWCFVFLLVTMVVPVGLMMLVDVKKGKKEAEQFIDYQFYGVREIEQKRSSNVL